MSIRTLYADASNCTHKRTICWMHTMYAFAAIGCRVCCVNADWRQKSYNQCVRNFVVRNSVQYNLASWTMNTHTHTTQRLGSVSAGRRVLCQTISNINVRTTRTTPLASISHDQDTGIRTQEIPLAQKNNIAPQRRHTNERDFHVFT